MKRAWHILLALALVAQVALAAMPATPKSAVKILPIPPVGPSPITPDCRYLFVVDTSSAMQRSADGLYRTTHRLIANGLGGRMQEGDVFTIWTYADTVLTREFPLNAWTPDLNIALANRTYEFLAKQKFRGKSNLRPVFAELGQALAIATNLTVVLISDGTDVIVGTPFDRPINVTYGKRASEMRSARMPFITALMTQRGEFTHWSVRGGLEDIGLPFPEKPIVPVPLVAQSPPVTTLTPTPIPIPVVTNLPAASSVAVVPKPAPPVAAALETTAKPAASVPPSPKPVETPKPPPTVGINTNTTPTKPPTTPAPKPPEPAPAIVVTKKVEPVPAPAPGKAAVIPSAPVASPKPEAKAALPPPPKPVVEITKPPTPAPKPVASVAPINPPAPPVPVPVPVAKPQESPVTAAIPPVVQPIIPPALRQPKSHVDATNALAKVELLRPPATNSTPPTKPLEARVLEPKPAPQKITNAPVTAAKTGLPPTVTNPPATAPATNTAFLATSPKTIPLIIPQSQTTSTPPRAVSAPAPLPKPVLAATNLPTTKTNVVAATANTTNSPPKARAEAPAPKSGAMQTKSVPATEPKSTKGQLAVASPQIRSGGWGYLAAAVGLLVFAGAIIGHLLRPRPTPSAISQSLDDKRV